MSNRKNVGSDIRLLGRLPRYQDKPWRGRGVNCIFIFNCIFSIMFKQGTSLVLKLARASVPAMAPNIPLRTRGFSSKGPKTLVTSVQTNEAYARKFWHWIYRYIKLTTNVAFAHYVCTPE